jgi:hypothetical protein
MSLVLPSLGSAAAADPLATDLNSAAKKAS